MKYKPKKKFEEPPEKINRPTGWIEVVYHIPGQTIKVQL